MRTFTTLFALLPAASLISASALPSNNEGITDGEVPDACKEVCRPLVQLSSTCQSGSTDAKAEADCICKNTSFDVKTVGSLCTICVTQNNALTDNLKSISSQCGFQQTSYNQATANSIANSIVVTATAPGSGQVVTGSASPTTQKLGATTTTSKGGAAPARTVAVGVIAAALAVAPMGYM